MCPSTVEWIHKVKYFEEVKINKALLHTAAWMNLSDIILSKRSQVQKIINCKIKFKNRQK